MLWQRKLHKSKVSHIGFSPREPWMFVTASIDHTVKVWDIRKMQDPGTDKMVDCLQTLEHEKGVNNAEVSLLIFGIFLIWPGILYETC